MREKTKGTEIPASNRAHNRVRELVVLTRDFEARPMSGKIRLAKLIRIILLAEVHGQMLQHEGNIKGHEYMLAESMNRILEGE